jgi:pyruvate kinase
LPITWNRTKVVATIGPACRDPKTLRKLIRAGVDVVRVNLSHGSLDEHSRAISAVRGISESLGWPIAVIADLPGPKLRVGEIVLGTVLRAGSTFVLTTKTRVGDETGACVSYRGLPRDVKRGKMLYLDDGMIRLEVISTTDTTVRCRVVEGGPLSSRKGLNAPGTDLRIGALTARDRKAIEWIAGQDVDYVALSFVRRPSDLGLARRHLATAGADSMPVIAKIEKAEAMIAMSEVVGASDGVMVARGDLGVELAPARVPFAQKRLIAEANAAAVPSITATQMLESMRVNPRPTRAEVADVANAVLDGTDAVMLSGETAVGNHPIESVETMASVVAEAERQVDYTEWLARRHGLREDTPDQAIGLAACTLAAEVNAVAIVTFTASGATARAVSRYRPRAPILGVTTDRRTWRRLSLVWGVRPILVEKVAGFECMLTEARKAVRSAKLGRKGDRFVLTAGLPFGIAAGTTNTITVRQI